MTRPIDELAKRAQTPIRIDDNFKIVADPADIAEQRRAHVIGLAQYLADVAPKADPMNPRAALRASEVRKFDRKHRDIAELDKLASPPPSLGLALAALDLI